MENVLDGFSRLKRVHTAVNTINQENAMSINQPIKKGDKVAYYIQRRISTGHQRVRRVGTVQGWRNGKVVVLHPAKYTELVAETDLYFVE